MKYYGFAVDPNILPTDWIEIIKDTGIKAGISPIIVDEGYEIQHIVFYDTEEKVNKVYKLFENYTTDKPEVIDENKVYDLLATIVVGHFCFMASVVTWLNGFSMPKDFVWFDRIINNIEDKAFTAKQLLDAYINWEDEVIYAEDFDYENVMYDGIGALEFLKYINVINDTQSDILCENLSLKAEAREFERFTQLERRLKDD